MIQILEVDELSFRIFPWSTPKVFVKFEKFEMNVMLVVTLKENRHLHLPYWILSIILKSLPNFENFQAAVIACQKLKEKMKSVREKMKDPSWRQLVKQCHMAGVDLSAHHMLVNQWSGELFGNNLIY